MEKVVHITPMFMLTYSRMILHTSYIENVSINKYSGM